MPIKKLAIAVAVILIALPAAALDTSELLALVTMPLAVAAAADLPRVPQQDLIDLVTQLNQANVPPTEFVQVVRYVPVALVDQNGQPQIVEYVTTETRRGVTGTRLATSVADELRLRYDVPRFEVTQPVVVETQLVPAIVVQRVNTDLLSLVGMPLAVAAVAEIAGVPQRDLIDFVTTLNQARVPPTQFVQVVQESRVAFVDTQVSPQFVQYVTTQASNGVTGPALVTVVNERLRTVSPTVRVAPTVQVTEVQRVHPHGGPPGQLKKVLGVQTGAQVVHGGHPGKGHGRGHVKQQPVFVPQPMISSAPAPVPVQKIHGNPNKGGGNPHGGGKGHGKGKG